MEVVADIVVLQVLGTEVAAALEDNPVEGEREEERHTKAAAGGVVAVAAVAADDTLVAAGVGVEVRAAVVHYKVP